MMSLIQRWQDRRASKRAASAEVLAASREMGAFNDILLWQNARLGFISVPKTGNTSIKLALAQALSPLSEEEQGEVERDVQSIHRLMRARRALRSNKSRLARRSDALVFTVVRNPWARVASFHRDKVLGCGFPPAMQRRLHQAYGIGHGDSLLKTLDAIARVPDEHAEIHFRSQSALFDWHGRQLPTAIFRFEALNLAWTTVRGYVRQVTGLALSDLPHANATVDASHRELFGPREKDLVYRRYRTDIERFGYEF